MYDVRYFYAPRTKPEKYQLWLKDVSLYSQEGADLGARMHMAALETQEMGYKKVVMMQAGVQNIRHKDIYAVFKELQKTKVVLALSKGNCVFSGMDQVYPDLLQEIPWNSEESFKKTCKILKDNKIVFQLLDIKSDIEFEEDISDEKMEYFITGKSQKSFV